jgi:hypothetical protein
VGVTHVYIFCAKSTILLPCDYEFDSISLTFPTQAWLTPGASRTKPVPLKGFAASTADAPDGLTRQFRLKTHFAALPPGAVEEGRIELMLPDDHNESDAVYRLRLHSAAQFYDFSFRLAIRYKPKIKDDQDKTRGKKKQTK